MYRLRRVILSVLFIAAFCAVTYAEESAFVKAFMAAYDEKNEEKLSSIVMLYREKVPAEVSALIEKALSKEASPEERDSSLYVAELIAKAYNERTGDPGPLREVKKKVFDSRLGAEVRPEPVEGVYVVELPRAEGEVKNVFRPDNIVIGRGSTVRWVNRDDIAHIFSSVPFIGEGGLFTPSVKPSETYESRFDKPGEYYYICFIHKGMVGKVTVIDASSAGGEAK